MKKLKTIINNIINWEPSKWATIVFLLLPTLCFAFTIYRLDGDFWFLVNTGKHITNHGFPNIEPFTIHAGLSYMPQQWLTTLIFYFIYNNFGIMGMLIFTILINYLIIYLIYQIVMIISKRKITAILVTVVGDMVLIFSNILISRPQIFDVVLILSEILVLEKYLLNSEKKYLYILPFISLLFINLHSATWLMMFVFMLPYYVEYLYKKRKKEKIFKIKPLMIITMICLFVGLINPYGIDSITYLFKSYGIKEINQFVAEMRAIDINHDLNLCVHIFIIMYLIYRNKGQNTIRFVVMFLGTTYLMLSHVRGTMFFEIASILVVADIFKNSKNTIQKEISVNSKDKIIYVGLIIIILLITFSNLKTKNNHILEPFVAYLDKNATKNIKLYTGYDDGGYFEYKGYKCYIDSRAEVFLKANNKKEDIFIEYYKLGTYHLNASKFLKKYSFDYLVVDNLNLAITNELKHNKNYKLVKEIKYTNKNYNYEAYLYKNISKN